MSVTFLSVSYKFWKCKTGLALQILIEAFAQATTGIGVRQSVSQLRNLYDSVGPLFGSGSGPNKEQYIDYLRDGCMLLHDEKHPG